MTYMTVCAESWGGVRVSHLKTIIEGRARWLAPVIQALWRPRWADHLRSGVQDQPDQHGETLSLKKKKKKKNRVRYIAVFSTSS